MENFTDRFPTADQVASFIKMNESIFADMAKNTEYRMQNYFNCVDDYSWGGICDQAQDEDRRHRAGANEILKQQLAHGKPYIKEFTTNLLSDMAGNIVSERLVKGRYGLCWIIGEDQNVSFIGTAKKQSTYNKKGYKLLEKVLTVEYYFTTTLCKNGLISVGRILKEELREVVEMPEYGVSTKLDPVAYFASK